MTTASPSGLQRTARWARVLGLAAACALLADCGILGDLRANPGFAPFGSPGVADTDRELALSIGPLPLKVARFVTHDDPQISQMLGDLKAVRVYTYVVDGDTGRVRERMDAVRDRLVSEGWHQIVAVRDDGELVDALVKMGRSGTIHGMAVLAQDDTDLVLVNLIGDIRPETFGTLMAELDIEVPNVTVRR